jgi:hypothetical protein
MQPEGAEVKDNAEAHADGPAAMALDAQNDAADEKQAADGAGGADGKDSKDSKDSSQSAVDGAAAKPLPTQPVTMFDEVLLKAELSGAISNLIAKRDAEKITSMPELLRQFLNDKFALEQFPEFCKLAQLALSLPVATADCERGYSAMNLVKTLLRTRLGTGRLIDLMRATIYNIPANEIAWEEVLKIWYSKRTRMVNLSLPVKGDKMSGSQSSSSSSGSKSRPSL